MGNKTEGCSCAEAQSEPVLSITTEKPVELETHTARNGVGVPLSPLPAQPSWEHCMLLGHDWLSKSTERDRHENSAIAMSNL